MIIFKKIKYKNFLSTGNQFNEIDFQKAKNTLLCGQNGGGKSTIADTICFALYGKPFRKINKPQLINNKNKKDLLVILEFENMGKSYKIVRGMKPNIFEIYENDKKLNSMASVLDDQEFLEENILRMSYKTFTQIVVVGKATFVPFMRLLPNDRRLIVEDLFDINIFSKMNLILKDRINSTNTELEQITNNILVLEKALKMQEDFLKNNIEFIDIGIEEKEREIAEKKVKIKENEEKIQQYIKIINEQNKVNDRIKVIENKIQNGSNILVELKLKLNNSNKEIEFFNNNNSCSLCKQAINHSHKQTIILTEQDAKKRYEEKINEINLIIEKYDKKYKKLQRAKKIIEDTVFQIQILQKDNEYLNNLIKKLEEDINTRKTDEKRTREEIGKNLEKIKNEIEASNQRRLELYREQQINSFAALLLKDDGIKTEIIRYYLPKINSLINQYLHAMNFFINFKLNENFEEEITNKAFEGFTYDNFSEGERLRIDLAILFAWRDLTEMRNSSSTNLLILDEIFDSSLDGIGIEDFLRILHNFSNKANIFVTSHKDDQIMDKFDRVLRFEKKSNFTKITQI